MGYQNNLHVNCILPFEFSDRTEREALLQLRDLALVAAFVAAANCTNSSGGQWKSSHCFPDRDLLELCVKIRTTCSARAAILFRMNQACTFSSWSHEE